MSCLAVQLMNRSRVHTSQGIVLKYPKHHDILVYPKYLTFSNQEVIHMYGYDRIRLDKNGYIRLSLWSELPDGGRRGRRGRAAGADAQPADQPAQPAQPEATPARGRSGKLKA